MMTLSSIISNRSKLNYNQISALVSIFGEYCSKKTKLALYHAFEYPEALPVYGIFNRVMISENGASYCAGQDYRAEVKTVRNCILNR